MTCCWGSFFMKAVQLQIQIENLTQSNIQSRLCILKAQQFKYFPNPSAGENTTCSCCRGKYILLLHAGQSFAAGKYPASSCCCRGKYNLLLLQGKYSPSSFSRELYNLLLLQGEPAPAREKGNLWFQAADQSVSSAADQCCASTVVQLCCSSSCAV